MTPENPPIRWLYHTFLRAELILPILTTFGFFEISSVHDQPNPIWRAKHLNIEVSLAHQLIKAYRVTAYDDWMDNEIDNPFNSILFDVPEVYWGAIE